MSDTRAKLEHMGRIALELHEKHWEVSVLALGREGGSVSPPVNISWHSRMLSGLLLQPFCCLAGPFASWSSGAPELLRVRGAEVSSPQGRKGRGDSEGGQGNQRPQGERQEETIRGCQAPPDHFEEG